MAPFLFPNFHQYMAENSSQGLPKKVAEFSQWGSPQVPWKVGLSTPGGPLGPRAPLLSEASSLFFQKQFLCYCRTGDQYYVII